MAVRRNIRTGYGFGQSLINTSPQPIIAQRAPKTSDFAEIGSIFIDQPNNDAYVLVKIASNSATWQNIAGGAGAFDTLNVTTDAEVGGTLDVTGAAAFDADVEVGGDIKPDGDIEIQVAAKGIVFQEGPKVIAGAGSPDTVVVAPKGSLYLRTDGTGVADRAYINTDGTTAWSSLTTAA